MTTRRVVVGVDDSSTARAALAWAVDEALLRNAELHIVHTFQPSGLIMPAIAYGAEYEDLQASAEALLHGMAAEARAYGDGRLAAVEEVMTEGDPGCTLVAYAKDCEMLVVGSRKRGALARVALGSCSHYCAQHARCPIVIIPPVEC